MFVSISETKPPLSDKPFLFFNDQRTGNMRSVGQYGNVTATDAAALGEGSGAPELKVGATRFPADTGSQSTCANEIGSFGITHKT